MQYKDKFLNKIILSIILFTSGFIFSMEKEDSKVFEFKKLPLDIQKVIINDFVELKDLFNVNLVNKDFKSLVNIVKLTERKKEANALALELINILESISIIDDLDFCDDKIKQNRSKEIINSSNVNLDWQDNNGKNSLMISSVQGYEEMVKLLIDNGAKLNMRDNSGKTALIYASRKSNTRIIQLLVDKGASINMQDNVGWTALMYAIAIGKNKIVKLLIDKGSDLYLNDCTGYTALKHAEIKKNKEIIKLLQDAENNLNKKRKNEEELSDLSKKIKLDQ